MCLPVTCQCLLGGEGGSARLWPLLACRDDARLPWPCRREGRLRRAAAYQEVENCTFHKATRQPKDGPFFFFFCLFSWVSLFCFFFFFFVSTLAYLTWQLP